MQRGFKIRRATIAAAVVLLLAALVIPSASAMQPRPEAPEPSQPGKARPEPSGIYDFRDPSVRTQAAGPSIASHTAAVSGTNITECPQAGLSNEQPKPLDVRVVDQVENLSNKGDDIRTNQDYSCFPQDETSIAVNPRNPRNLI